MKRTTSQPATRTTTPHTTPRRFTRLRTFGMAAALSLAIAGGITGAGHTVPIHAQAQAPATPAGFQVFPRDTTVNIGQTVGFPMITSTPILRNFTWFAPPSLVPQVSWGDGTRGTLTTSDVITAGGQAATLMGGSHAWQTSGTYTVTVSYVTGAYQVITASFRVTVAAPAPPQADFTSAVSSQPANLPNDSVQKGK